MTSYESKTTRLRPLKPSDIEKSQVWRNDLKIRDHALGYRFPVTEVMEQKWYEAALNDQSNNRVIYAIETLEERVLIGFIQLTNIDWVARTGYVGLCIGERQYQGKNRAVDTSQVMFNYAFDCLNIRKICIEVAAFNPHVLKTYQRKFGFVEEGRLKQQLFFKGEYHDLIVLGLFAEAYRSAHADVAEVG